MIKTHPAIKDGIKFLKTLTVGKLINFLILGCSYYCSILLRKPVHRGLPASISIEPTTSCNLSCPECPAGLKKFSRPVGTLPLNQFRAYIDGLKGHLMYLTLYFQGEPLLNKHFFDMVSYASGKGIYTATSTNAHFLKDELAKKTVESGLHRMIISIDGTTQETYEKYRKEGRLQEVLDGINELIKWKKKLNSGTPYIIIQFLVFRHNEHQIADIKALARRPGIDKLELKSAQVYDFEKGSGLIPLNKKYARYKQEKDGWSLKKPVKNRCFRMWSGAVITWDGRVVPCCFDKDADHQMGSLDQNSFREIWRSDAYTSFRKQLFSDRKRIEICRNCTE